MASPKTNWHSDVFFGIHYDFHATAEDTALGKEITHEHLRERLLQVKPDWVHCDCKGIGGYTSWPTKVGTTAPGMVQDQLRIYRDVTRELGIRLGVHYCGIWDTHAIELHPEWAYIHADGTPDPNYTCRLSGYDEQRMIPQMLEIIDSYDVDSFWVDAENWAAQPCRCERCKAEFTRRTGITEEEIPSEAGQPHWDRWLAFHRDLFVAHVTRYTEGVHARKPGCLVASNWMYTVRQPEAVAAPVDYLSGDYDWAYGSNRAAIEGRLLDGQGMPWNLMAWGFTKTGKMEGEMPWVMKPVVHLCQEVAEVVALGGAVMVYNQPQRTGWLTGWQQEVIAEVAQFCRAREETCFKSHSRSEVAVLHLADHFYATNDPLYNYGTAVQPVEGALHALLETQHSTDVLTEDGALERMRDYKLVVVPEQTRLSRRIRAALEDYARQGGHVLITGAHLAPEYPAVVGATPAGDPITAPVYLPVEGRAVGVFGPWHAVKPDARTEVLGYRLEEQEPEKDTTHDIIITRRRVGSGSIVAVHGPLFRNYFLGHYPLLRRFIAALIDQFAIPWQVTLDAPAKLEPVVREKDGRLLVNLINRGAGETLTPQRLIVEELAPVENVVVRVRCAEQPKSVSVLPGDDEIQWSYREGMLTIEIPRIEIHSVITIA